MKSLRLASGSPRRKQILEENGFNFSVLSVDVDESRKARESPKKFCERLAEEKALASYKKFPEENVLILAADTIVFLEDEIFGKPKDENDAFSMLSKLSGRKHFVMTAVAILDSETQNLTVISDVTEVKFKNINDLDIKDYLITKEYTDKAGAYGIQGKASEFIDFITGSYWNVVGLPIEKIQEKIKKDLAK